jgi:hypothetical protein
MENNQVPEFRRKRGRPPLNKPLNGNAPKYHLKAPQRADAPKAVATPTEQRSPDVEEVAVACQPLIADGAIEGTLDAITRKVMDDLVDQPKHVDQTPTADLTPVDSIEFVNGKNTLKIVLSKKHNRMYRVQVYLNNTMEIRPATYTGFAPASTFWGFLKEITK